MTAQTDFTQYQPPGVYFDEVATSLAPVVGVPPVVVALVGQAVGFRTTTEQISLADDGAVLKNLGVIPNSIAVVRLDTGDTVAPSDYTVSNPTGSPLVNQNYTTEIARATGSATDEGTTVAVTYNYQEPTYFDPKAFDNFEDIKDAYGQPLNFVAPAPGDTNYQAVLSPLSLAAQLEFNNGARSLVLVPVAAPTGADAAARSASLRTSLSAAYAKIATDSSINIVVPVTAGIIPADAAQAANDLKVHVTNATNDGFRRIGIIGFDPPASGAGVDAAVLAQNVKFKRIILAYASGLGLSFYVSQTGQTITLGEGYLAAAYGGMFARLPIQKALTQETVQGFTGIVGQPLSNKAKNALGDAGVAVTFNRFGSLVVRHGTSTDRTNVNTREISLVRERDAMVEVLDTGLNDPTLIGQPITTETLLNVKGAVANLLEICVASGVIISYSGLGVRLRTTDPSVIEVKFAFQPAYPLNYIEVTFAVDTTTGIVDTTGLAA